MKAPIMFLPWRLFDSFLPPMDEIDLSEKGGRHLHKIDPSPPPRAANPTRSPMTPATHLTQYQSSRSHARRDDGFAHAFEGRYILWSLHRRTMIGMCSRCRLRQAMRQRRQDDVGSCLIGDDVVLSV